MNKKSFERFTQNKIAFVSMILFLSITALVFLLPIILNLDPNKIYSGSFSAPPTEGHILGFDNSGRDMLARVLYGGRVTLTVGFFSTLLSLAIGIPLGLLSGYYRGILETVIMRFADVLIAFPTLLLILVITSMTEPSTIVIVVVLGAIRLTTFTRLLHGMVLSVREADYVEAARAIGTKDKDILLKYILPNAIGPVLVQIAFVFSTNMVYEAGLSFLGVGVRPPTASWGNILNAAQTITVLAYKPWMWLPAGGLFVIVVLCLNFTGDGMRRAFDPKENR
jgi:peptide/nickel transport system permease protein